MRARLRPDDLGVVVGGYPYQGVVTSVRRDNPYHPDTTYVTVLQDPMGDYGGVRPLITMAEFAWEEDLGEA